MKSMQQTKPKDCKSPSEGFACAFSQGSTTEDGRKLAPDMCRQAVFNKFKTRIEKCHINTAEDCPLERYIPMHDEMYKVA